MNRRRLVLLASAAVCLAVWWRVAAAGPDRRSLPEYRRAVEALAEAQRRGDAAEVARVAAEAAGILGDQAGVPEVPDEFRTPPADVKPLSADEARAAFARFLPSVERGRWWRIGLDPAKTPHLPREAASVLTGCLAARRGGTAPADRLLAAAREAGDYLVWTQEQGGRGVYPFPAYRGGSGGAFESADRFLRMAERKGLTDRIVRNGWAVEDLTDGGLQFDNGLCGVAMLELAEATGDARYRRSALAAADWAAGRPVVTNWNYNSFSVYLLARAYAATSDRKYLEAAKLKFRLGVAPGRLRDGPRAGRWADPHNARPAYHYIMVRAMAALLAVMPADDADRPALVECLRAALQARNPDFPARGVGNVDSALEALLLVSALGEPMQRELAGTATPEALAVLERHIAAGIRAGKGPASPGVFGRYLEYLSRR